MTAQSSTQSTGQSPYAGPVAYSQASINLGKEKECELKIKEEGFNPASSFWEKALLELDCHYDFALWIDEESLSLLSTAHQEGYSLQISDVCIIHHHSKFYLVLGNFSLVAPTTQSKVSTWAMAMSALSSHGYFSNPDTLKILTQNLAATTDNCHLPDLVSDTLISQAKLLHPKNEFAWVVLTFNACQCFHELIGNKGVNEIWEAMLIKIGNECTVDLKVVGFHHLLKILAAGMQERPVFHHRVAALLSSATFLLFAYAQKGGDSENHIPYLVSNSSRPLLQLEIDGAYTLWLNYDPVTTIQTVIQSFDTTFKIFNEKERLFLKQLFDVVVPEENLLKSPLEGFSPKIDALRDVAVENLTHDDSFVRSLCYYHVLADAKAPLTANKIVLALRYLPRLLGQEISPTIKRNLLIYVGTIVRHIPCPSMASAIDRLWAHFTESADTEEKIDEKEWMRRLTLALCNTQEDTWCQLAHYLWVNEQLWEDEDFTCKYLAALLPNQLEIALRPLLILLRHQHEFEESYALFLDLARKIKDSKEPLTAVINLPWLVDCVKEFHLILLSKQDLPQHIVRESLELFEWMTPYCEAENFTEEMKAVTRHLQGCLQEEISPPVHVVTPQEIFEGTFKIFLTIVENKEWQKALDQWKKLEGLGGFIGNEEAAEIVEIIVELASVKESDRSIHLKLNLLHALISSQRNGLKDNHLQIVMKAVLDYLKGVGEADRIVSVPCLVYILQQTFDEHVGYYSKDKQKEVAPLCVSFMESLKGGSKVSLQELVEKVSLYQNDLFAALYAHGEEKAFINFLFLLVFYKITSPISKEISENFFEILENEWLQEMDRATLMRWHNVLNSSYTCGRIPSNLFTFALLCTIIDKLLNSKMYSQAIEWIERVVQTLGDATEENKEPYEAVYRWLSLLVNVGEYSVSFKFLEDLKKKKGIHEERLGKISISIAEKISKTDSPKALEIFYEFRAYLDEHHRQFVGECVHHMLLLNDLNSDKLNKCLVLFIQVKFDKVASWEKLLARIFKNGSNVLKQTVYPTVKLIDELSLLRDSPEQRAQCWIWGIKCAEISKTSAFAMLLGERSGDHDEGGSLYDGVESETMPELVGDVSDTNNPTENKSLLHQIFSTGLSYINKFEGFFSLITGWLQEVKNPTLYPDSLSDLGDLSRQVMPDSTEEQKVTQRSVSLRKEVALTTLLLKSEDPSLFEIACERLVALPIGNESAEDSEALLVVLDEISGRFVAHVKNPQTMSHSVELINILKGLRCEDTRYFHILEGFYKTLDLDVIEDICNAIVTRLLRQKKSGKGKMHLTISHPETSYPVVSDSLRMLDQSNQEEYLKVVHLCLTNENIKRYLSQEDYIQLLGDHLVSYFESELDNAGDPLRMIKIFFAEYPKIRKVYAQEEKLIPLAFTFILQNLGDSECKSQSLAYLQIGQFFHLVENGVDSRSPKRGSIVDSTVTTLRQAKFEVLSFPRHPMSPVLSTEKEVSPRNVGKDDPKVNDLRLSCLEKAALMDPGGMWRRERILDYVSGCLLTFIRSDVEHERVRCLIERIGFTSYRIAKNFIPHHKESMKKLCVAAHEKGLFQGEEERLLAITFAAGFETHQPIKRTAKKDSVAFICNFINRALGAYRKKGDPSYLWRAALVFEKKQGSVFKYSYATGIKLFKQLMIETMERANQALGWKCMEILSLFQGTIRSEDIHELYHWYLDMIEIYRWNPFYHVDDLVIRVHTMNTFITEERLLLLNGTSPGQKMAADLFTKFFIAMMEVHFGNYLLCSKEQKYSLYDKSFEFLNKGLSLNVYAFNLVSYYEALEYSISSCLERIEKMQDPEHALWFSRMIFRKINEEAEESKEEKIAKVKTLRIFICELCNISLFDTAWAIFREASTLLPYPFDDVEDELKLITKALKRNENLAEVTLTLGN